MEFTDIIYEKKDHIAWITINRPKKLNALRELSWKELGDAIYDANLDSCVGVIVITGAGDRSFCAGGDISEKETLELIENSQRVLNYIIGSPKPVIAAVNGYAIGGGHWLHVICDLTIASENAIFGQNGPRVGSPASGFIVSYLAKVVGQKRAREIWMLCRRYTAKEAYEMGLVNKVVPLAELKDEVKRWCDEILSLSPTCLRLIKASFLKECEYLLGILPSELIAPGFLETEESREGIKAFQEKRAPNFNQFRV